RETSSSIVEMEASIAEIAAHMDHLASSIETTSAAASQVAGSSEQVVDGIGTLMTASNDSGMRLGQLRQSVELVQGNAQASHELSDDTSQEAARGLEAVNETIRSMSEISASFRELESSVSTLAEKSASIDEIVQVIQDVADQTGMLSLNASIIAAQAGEHGKAFSVVADEVNNLAQSTHRSTGQIAGLIRAVQEDTQAAVAAAEAGAARVELGVQRSNLAGDMLLRISDKSANTAARVREILEASSRQISDLEQVDQSMRSVAQMVERFDRSARDQQGAASEIDVAVEAIRRLGLEVRRSTEEQSRGSSLITNAVTDATNMVSEIVEATRAQAKSSEDIEHALEVFRDVANETNRRVGAIKEMIAMLSERSRRLSDEIGRFRTD
ncbi:MAG: methyl-accepting chemotaxis protein, partial [Myxococcota bacterium]